jgi:pimeloyl-ACP methyl ester carboxylesterase
MVDRGSGLPFVLVPGVQGRWEWTATTVDALAARSRILTFSLCDEPGSGFTFDPASPMTSYVNQIAEALDRARVEQGVIVGVSYGGLIAAEFAARYPRRVLGLVLASALPLKWQPDRRARFYLRAPRLLSPLFCLTSPARMWPEVRAAIPRGGRVRFLLSYGYRAMRATMSPVRMARRLRSLEAHTFCEPGRIEAPTLVITGEDRLDRVVPPARTREYMQQLRCARHVMLPQTGHIGLVTKPEVFADLVCQFANEISTDGKRISA